MRRRYQDRERGLVREKVAKAAGKTVEFEPPKLDYARPPLGPSRLSAANYVTATLGGMFVFGASLILLSILVSVIAPWLGAPAIYIAYFLIFALAILAGASSFRASLGYSRIKRERLFRQYSMPRRWDE